MVSKNNIIFNSYDVAFIIGIILFQILQYFYLNSCLMLEFLFVSNDFQSKIFFSFKIINFQSLSKRSFSKRCNHFKSICSMISYLNLIISFVIIITEIKLIGCASFYLSFTFFSNIPHLFVI